MGRTMARHPIRRLQIDGHVASLARPSAIRSLVGLVILGLGIALAVNHDTVEVHHGDTGERVSEAGVLMLGGVIGLLGLLLASFRRGVRFDRARRTVEHWWGFGPFRRRSEQPLGELGIVRVRRVVTSGGNGSSTSYPVDLMGRSGNATLLLLRAVGPIDARATGEDVAKFLGLPLREGLSGPETERAPEHLDRSFREAVLAEGERPPYPVLPLASKVLAEHNGPRWIVAFPALGALRVGAGLGLALLPPSLLFVAVAYVMFGDSFGEALPWLAGFALVPNVVLLLVGLIRGSARQAVEVLPGRIAVETRLLGGLRSIQRMGWDELEQVQVREPPRTPLSGLLGRGEVVLVSDQRRIHVGRAGRPEDREFLVALLRHALTEPLDSDADLRRSTPPHEAAGRGGSSSR